MEFLKVGGSIERCEYWDNNSRDYSNSFVPSYCNIITKPKPIVNFSSTSYQLVSPPDAETSISNPVSTQINEAILSMTKMKVYPLQISGKLLLYYFYYQCVGNTDATNIVFTDALPSGLTFVPNTLISMAFYNLTRIQIQVYYLQHFHQMNI